MTQTSPLRAYESYARQQDARDALASCRDRFLIPKSQSGDDLIYMCGHSLGLQHRDAEREVLAELDTWRRLAVEGHFAGDRPWTTGPDDLTPMMARIVGAKPAEVVVMNALTVNLHLMLVSFYRPYHTRARILIEPRSFPSDRYAVSSQIRFRGFEPESDLVEIPLRAGEHVLRTEDILRFLHDEGRSVALVLLGGINYFTGQFFDIEAITSAAHAAGCLVGLDLAHAVGNVPLKLHDWNVDFAVWCSYKYLNSGPGGPGACFIHERHLHSGSLPRFEGWWGNRLATRFDMAPSFDSDNTALAWQLSNPSILARAAMRPSLHVFDEVGMEAVREKSVRLTRFCEEAIQHYCGDRVKILTPGDVSSRGAQLSLKVGTDAARVVERLHREGIRCDWRPPDVIRVAPAPLYNTFTDVLTFVTRLTDAL